MVKQTNGDEGCQRLMWNPWQCIAAKTVNTHVGGEATQTLALSIVTLAVTIAIFLVLGTVINRAMIVVNATAVTRMLVTKTAQHAALLRTNRLKATMHALSAMVATLVIFGCKPIYTKKAYAPHVLKKSSKIKEISTNASPVLLLNAAPTITRLGVVVGQGATSNATSVLTLTVQTTNSEVGHAPTEPTGLSATHAPTSNAAKTNSGAVHVLAPTMGTAAPRVATLTATPTCTKR